ncbi:unnamed protein product [Penicillium salamii]|uniref:F-box domain-containing protein n=1 Tax=Penicillium salamii TaxID=1612424 RepID=A0A9W4N2K6_9EURO|nr:unnamed protein product [Penicillium salamii]CAG8236186.1 unnamed protein product [Penicillium salamii]CAG8252159.1 unnamed protein product [Penicillium salamii]CAG8264560.1 unnamed protein product [Penicillium salamii]CAG8350869.1 unnamed protein product [Penicillium salamii]
MLNLPIELVNKTCSYLEQPEWAALRLSCRSLYAKSLDAFADRYFKSICFIATSEGIRQLEELTNNETIRVRVRHLWMIPTVFEGHHGWSLDDFYFSPYRGPMSYLRASRLRDSRLSENDDVLVARYATYQAIKADNLALLESNTFGSRLHACFASFRNLESVGLKHYATDFLLDIRQTEVRCLGLQELKNQVQYVSHRSTFDRLRRHQVAKVNSLALSRMIQGLNKSNPKITKLSTCGANCCGSTSPILPLTREQYDSLLPKLEDLEKLHICICYTEDDLNCTPNSITYIDLLISVAPRLKRLVFSQWYRGPRDLEARYFSELSQSISFTRLKELHLHWIQIRLESFKSFLNTTKGTMVSLSLDLVTLQPSALPSTDYGPTCWRLLWDFLQAEMSLKRCYMGQLGYQRRKVMIQGPDELAELTYTATYNADVNGICFKDWIGQLKPIVSEELDLPVRRYPGLQSTKPPKATEPFPNTHCQNYLLCLDGAHLLHTFEYASDPSDPSDPAD